MSETVFARDTVLDTTRPAGKSSCDLLTVGVLATELLEQMGRGKIAHHPLQKTSHLRPEKLQAITHAILDLTGFPISKSREANGLSLPSANDMAIAETFVTAARLALDATRNKTDSLRAISQSAMHTEWIRATARAAIPSAQNLIAHPNEDTAMPKSDEPTKKKITVVDSGRPFARKAVFEYSFA